MHFKFLTRRIKHFSCRLDLGGGNAMVALCCRELPQLWEIFLFIRETNEPVMAIRGTTFHN